jgi:hypothetical protein
MYERIYVTNTNAIFGPKNHGKKKRLKGAGKGERKSNGTLYVGAFWK